MKSGLNCTHSVCQVLMHLINAPYLLDEYNFEKEDFEEDFHRIVFMAIYNIHNSGVDTVTPYSIETFLSKYPTQYEIFSSNRGLDYLDSSSIIMDKNNFEYYYKRMKKFSYLRYLESAGTDTTWIYNPSITEPVAQSAESERFDRTSIEEIIDSIEAKYVDEPRMRFTLKGRGKGQQAGLGLKALKEKLKEAPEIGIPMQSGIMNTIARGARRKTVYLKSGNSGSGKSRLGVGDICCYSVPYFYNTDKNKWIYTGFAEPSLFISTELDISEVQTIIIAYISGVDEGHILDGVYLHGEEERVDKAIEYIESSPLYIEELKDFTIQSVNALIKRYKREKNVGYVNFDYIHTSPSILMEISSMAKGTHLREDQILFLLMDSFKTMCGTLDVHMDTSTQVTGEYNDVKEKNATIIRGSKALADRVDLGVIALEPSKAELDGVEEIMRKMVGMPTPNLIQHVYKCRRGKLTKIRLYQYKDLGTCRTIDLFVTDNDYNLIEVEALTIENIEKAIEEVSVNEDTIVITQDEQVEASKHVLGW